MSNPDGEVLASRIAAVIAGLIEQWDTKSPQAPLDVPTRTHRFTPDGPEYGDGEFMLVWAFAGQAHECARALLAARAAAGDLASTPLMRAVLEFGMFADWIAAEPGRGTRFVAGDQSNIEGLRKPFAAAKSPQWRVIAEKIHVVDVAALDAGLPRTSVSAKKVAEEIGPEVYAYYRFLSQLSHPSALLAAQWAEPSPDPQFAAVLRTRGDRSPGAWGLWPTAVGLTMAQAAVDRCLGAPLFSDGVQEALGALAAVEASMGSDDDPR